MYIFFFLRLESVRGKNPDQGNWCPVLLTVGAAPGVPSGLGAANTLGLPQGATHHEHMTNLWTPEQTQNSICSWTNILWTQCILKIHIKMVTSWSSGKGAILPWDPSQCSSYGLLRHKGVIMLPCHGSLPSTINAHSAAGQLNHWFRSHRTVSCLPITCGKHTHLGTPPSSSS